MKNIKYKVLLLIEGILLFLLSAFDVINTESIFGVLAFPLNAFADFLGELSLSGSAGNAIAIVIYACVCLIPVAVMIFKSAKKSFQKTDSLLVLLSAVLFASIYLMINPSETGAIGIIDGISEILAVPAYSVLSGYLILNFVSDIKNRDSIKIEKLLAVVVKIVGAVFTYAIYSEGYGVFVDSFAELEQNSELGFITVLMLIFRTAIVVLPNSYGISIVFSALEFIYETGENRYSENTLAAAEKLGDKCVRTVIFCTFISMVYNVLQLRFIAEMPHVNFNLEIPLILIGFILAVLIMTRYLKDSKTLKEDNDAFI